MFLSIPIPTGSYVSNLITHVISVIDGNKNNVISNITLVDYPNSLYGLLKDYLLIQTQTRYMLVTNILILSL